MHGVILAGAPAPPALRERGVERIPLLKVQGETILDRTCRCLREAGCETIHVLAPADLAPLSPGSAYAPYSGDVITDFLALLRATAGGPALLLSSCDMPLLTGEAVAAVALAGPASGADVVYPVVERAVVERRFGISQRTYRRLGAITVTGGNVFYLNRSWLLAHGDELKRAFDLRKNPLGLARLFGLGFLLRVACGWADLAYLERHLSRVAHGALKAQVLPYAELAVDLDKLADLELFTPYLDPWA